MNFAGFVVLAFRPTFRRQADLAAIYGNLTRTAIHTVEPDRASLIEQDHRRVKQRVRPMLGFKRFDNAAVTIGGIELAEKIQEGSVQNRQVRESEGEHVGTVERGARRLTPLRTLNTEKLSQPRS